MTQAVELLLDPESDAAVREQWDLLEQAGLPSRARHGSPTNRPHVTVVGVADVPAEGEEPVARACVDRLPLEVRLGAPVVFGADPVVLVRLVIPTAGLLDLHGVVARLVGVAPGSRSAPGRWTPHVTLSHRLPRAQLPRALEVLPVEDRALVLDAARRWDSEAKREWPLR
jgi:hypothetical protein